MEFMNGMFGASGCNPDGTVGQNAFTSMADRMMESHFFEVQQSMAGMDPNVVFVEGDSFGGPGPQSMPPPMMMGGAAQQAPWGMPMSASPHMMMPGPMMMPHPHMMMMPPPQHHFAHPSMYQQQQHHHFEEDQEYYEDQQHYDHPQHAHDQAYSTQTELLQDDDELDVEAMNKLWDANLQQNGPWVVLDEQQAPSKAGYDSAWQQLESRLESGVLSASENSILIDNRVYTFQEHNRYMADSALRELPDNDLFEKGMEHFQRGELRSAIAAFEALVQRGDEGSESSESWRMLGVCHTENDEEKKAISCFIKAVETDPYNIEALLALGTSYMNELDSVKALETLRAWVAHNPPFAGLEVPQDEYSDGSLMDEVMQLMLAVVQYAPHDMDAQVVLGVLYNISLDYSNAVSCFKTSLSSNPESYNLLNKLAATLANSNRSEDAIPFYQEALQHRPTFARGWMNLGISYANLNQYEEAAKAYLRALHLSPQASHIWGYLRVVLNCMERNDLMQLSATENIQELAAKLNVDLIHSL